MGGGGGVVAFEPFCRPQDSERPAVFSEKVEADLGIGGKGMSLNGLSWGDLKSSRRGMSVDDGAVDAALNREDVSVESVFVLEAPLPLNNNQQMQLESVCT